MIKLTRPSLPDQVVNGLAEQTTRIAQAPSPKDMAKRLWKNASVRSKLLTPHVRPALENIAPGIARCMYCGDNEGSDIDHYWPKKEWPLRTFDWLNHLLACSKCNSANKGDRFPRDEHGAPLLVDPTVDDPAAHLHLVLGAGEYIGLTPRGDATITLLDLNRSTLMTGRRRAVAITALLLRAWREAVEDSDIVAEEETLQQLREQPFVGVADAVIRQAGAVAVEALFVRDPTTLEFLRDPDTLETASRSLVRQRRGL